MNNDKESTQESRVCGMHTKKDLLVAPVGKLDYFDVLAALDRDIAFYRRRAGQVFFLGLVFEILILAGREKESVIVPADPGWIKPLVYSVLFIAVLATGIALGREYRSRIRQIKDSRLELLNKANFKNAYPTERTQFLSEIQVLYVVLVFLSSMGTILVWLPDLLEIGRLTTEHAVFVVVFTSLGAAGISKAIWAVSRTWNRPST